MESKHGQSSSQDSPHPHHLFIYFFLFASLPLCLCCMSVCCCYLLFTICCFLCMFTNQDWYRETEREWEKEREREREWLLLAKRILPISWHIIVPYCCWCPCWCCVSSLLNTNIARQIYSCDIQMCICLFANRSANVFILNDDSKGRTGRTGRGGQLATA